MRVWREQGWQARGLEEGQGDYRTVQPRNSQTHVAELKGWEHPLEVVEVQVRLLEVEFAEGACVEGGPGKVGGCKVQGEQMSVQAALRCGWS